MRHTVRGDTLTAYLEGELDHHSASGLRDALETLLRDKALKRLVLDLSGLTFMDSSGIGVILGRYNTLARRGGRLTVRNARPTVEKVLRLSGIDRLTDVGRIKR